VSYKNFLEEFEKSLPLFLKNNSRAISNDIIDIMKFALERDGLEIRGAFSMKSEKGLNRKTLKFKDLTK
jgi:hypothetical protein